MNDLECLFARMNPGSYGPTEPHLWLVLKIPPRTWEDCRSTTERKRRTHSYDELVDLLIELSLERENDAHMEKFLKRHLGRTARGGETIVLGTTPALVAAVAATPIAVTVVLTTPTPEALALEVGVQEIPETYERCSGGILINTCPPSSTVVRLTTRVAPAMSAAAEKTADYQIRRSSEAPGSL